jgi:hypothetical protein
MLAQLAAAAAAAAAVVVPTADGVFADGVLAAVADCGTNWQ